MNWESIETAPKDGREILCWKAGWERPCFLRWKSNPRIEAAHRAGVNLDLAVEYWGDPREYDDYDDAKDGAAPTYWLPLVLPE